MGTDEDIAANSAPPSTPEEWRSIRSGTDKAHKGWVIVGPIYAAAVNWKAWLVVLAIVLYFNRPDIIAALRVLSGVGQ